MCPTTFQLCLVIIFFAVIVFTITSAYSHKWRSANINKNFETLARLLQSPQQQESSFSWTSLSGYYQGRKVVFSCLRPAAFDEGGCKSLFMEPKNIFQPLPFFMLTYPRPTRNTHWVGKKIYFSLEDFIALLHRNGSHVYSEEKFKEFLEELTTAAQMVETGTVSR